MAVSNDNTDQIEQCYQRVSDIDKEPLEMLMPIVGYEDMPIVPLDIALKPLVSLLPAVQSHAYVAKQRCKNPPPEGLTIDESASIMLYTMSWRPLEKCLYTALNATLRSKDRDKLHPWFLYLKLFLTALSRLPSKNQHVYRGVKSDLYQHYPKGNSVVWWGFSSSTDSIDALQSELFLGKTGTRTMFAIQCFSGKDIRQHSYFSTENEILLLAATEFIVQGCLDADNGLHIIQLQEKKSDHPLLTPILSTGTTNTVLFDNKIGKHTLTVKSFSFNSSDKSTTAMNNFTNNHEQSEPIPYQNLELEQKIQQYCSHSTIDLRGQKLTDKDMKIIVKYAIKQKQCEELELGSNEITLDGVRILAAALTNNKTLSYLSLWDNCLCDNSVSCLVEMLSINNNKLTILNLGKNEITDIGAKELAKILQTNQTLTELYLGDNRISDEGVRMLADSIENYNTTLERLFLFSNQSITDECVRHLLQLIMHNNTLKELSLNNCNLSKRSKEKLQMAARKVNFKLDVG